MADKSVRAGNKSEKYANLAFENLESVLQLDKKIDEFADHFNAYMSDFNAVAIDQGENFDIDWLKPEYSALVGQLPLLSNAFIGFFYTEDESGNRNKDRFAHDGIAKAFVHFVDLLNEKNISQFKSSDIGKTPHETVANYLRRYTIDPTNKQIYAHLLLFMLGLALKEPDRFIESPVVSSLTYIKPMIVGLLNEMRSGNVTPEQLIRVSRWFFNSSCYRGRLLQQMGGMLEFCSEDREILWGSVFGYYDVQKIKEWELNREESKERYYLCYRYTSLSESPEINKSFVVFQSPGRIKGKNFIMRDHFGVKFYTSSIGDELRRSAGSLLALGEKIVCFGNKTWWSQSLEDEPAAVKNLDPKHVPGAKAAIIEKDCFVKGGLILTGQMLTTNSHNETISANILCIETEHTHSNNVGLCRFESAHLLEDILEYSVLELDENYVDGDPEKLEDLNRMLLKKMHRSNSSHLNTDLDQNDPEVVAVSTAQKSTYHQFTQALKSMGIKNVKQERLK